MIDSSDDQGDEDWLAQLAGQTPRHGSADDPIARALRSQLSARREALDLRVPSADPMLLEQIQFRIRREQVRPGFLSRPSVWGVAASLVLGVAVVYQVALQNYDADEQVRLRNGDDRVMIRTVDPGRRSTEFAAELKAKGLEVQVDQSDPTQITLTVPNNAASAEFLRKHKIEYFSTGSRIVLVLVPKRR